MIVKVDLVIDLSKEYEELISDSKTLMMIMQDADKYIQESSSYLDQYGNKKLN